MCALSEASGCSLIGPFGDVNLQGLWIRKDYVCSFGGFGLQFNRPFRGVNLQGVQKWSESASADS